MKLDASDEPARALARAIRKGDLETLRGLLDADPALARAVIVDRKGVGRTLLHIATDWPGHFPRAAETIALLASAGSDLNAAAEAVSHHAETPLHWAASSDDVAAATALLDAGADIEAPGAVFTGGAPMSDAVIFAKWNVARLLLERGAKTTLCESAALGLLDRVETYLAAAPRPTPSDVTAAFWHSCRGGQLAVAQALLSRGVDPSWLGWDENTPLDAAIKGGAEPVIERLRALGAKRAAELRG